MGAGGPSGISKSPGSPRSTSAARGSRSTSRASSGAFAAAIEVHDLIADGDEVALRENVPRVRCGEFLRSGRATTMHWAVRYTATDESPGHGEAIRIPPAASI